MKSTLNFFILGLVLGAGIAAPLAYNHGRGAPLLSNPFIERTLGTVVKEKAEGLVEGAKEKMHDITKPLR
jgi:hypothetical protein